MSDPFVAEVRMLGCNFPPRGWAQCDGQLLPISQNTALFSLVGTFYGGDGRSTFALPNLQGSAPMHAGQGPGLSERFLGERGGDETITLDNGTMPSHPHTLQGFKNQIAPQPGNSVKAIPNALAQLAAGSGYSSNAPVSSLTNMAFQALALTGSGAPHNNMQPYLTINFCIALQGIFPPRG